MPPETDIGFQLIDDDNLLSIDRYAAGQVAPIPSRREVINEAIRDWASRQGLRHAEFVSQEAQPYDVTSNTSHDQVRTQAANALDLAMSQMTATDGEKDDRRRALTDEPKVIAAAKRTTAKGEH